MAVTAHAYPITIGKINSKLLDLTVVTAGSYFAALCTGDASVWGATQQGYAFYSDVATAYTEVAAGGGYTTGGVDISAGISLTRSNNVNKWTCTSPISFGSATTITARSMFIYTKLIGAGTTTWPVISIIDFGQNVISTGGAWAYTVDPTNGLVYWTEN